MSRTDSASALNGRQASWRALPKSVKALAVASFFTDVSSDAVYPIFPIFLTSVLGANASFVGVFEGLAEATVQVSKFFFGRLSDRLGEKKPLVFVGYALANVMRPIIGICATPLQALGLRLSDRLGKGMRSPGRDAWLANAAPPEQKGFVFGFHRAMDNAGAMVGGIFAAIFLYFFPENYRALFLMTLIPGALALVAVALAPGDAVAATKAAEKQKGDDWRRIRAYLMPAAVFMLANSSDAFLILRAKSIGIPVYAVPVLWVGLNFFKMAVSTPAGKRADVWGRKRSLLTGWSIFAVAYALFAATDKIWLYFVALAVYGVASAFFESAEKALIADFAHNKRGTAFGTVSCVGGLMTFLASYLTGVVSDARSLPFAFAISSALAMVAILIFMTTFREPA